MCLGFRLLGSRKGVRSIYPTEPLPRRSADSALDAKIFHLDVDPLKQQMPREFVLSIFTALVNLDSVFSINTTRRYRVSCDLALEQLHHYIEKRGINRRDYTAQFNARAERSRHWQRSLLSLESPSDDGVIRVPYLASRLRHLLPQDTVFVLEAVTNAGPLIHHLHLTQVSIWFPTSLTCLPESTNPSKPGTLIASGAGGLGWGGGAALGVKLAKPSTFICAMYV